MFVSGPHFCSQTCADVSMAVVAFLLAQIFKKAEEFKSGIFDLSSALVDEQIILSSLSCTCVKQ